MEETKELRNFWL